MDVRVGPPTVTIHADDEFAVCEVDGEMSSTKEQGYFAADTRLVSGTGSRSVVPGRCPATARPSSSILLALSSPIPRCWARTARRSHHAACT